MNILLILAQYTLASLFFLSGIFKLLQPIETLSEKMNWVKDSSAQRVRSIGIAEMIGALGLVLPWTLNILPILSPIAAMALGLVMVLAALEHLKYKEYGMIALNIILLLTAAFVAYGRLAWLGLL